MRQLFAAFAALLVAGGLGASPARAGKVEVKGVHLCCGQCIKAVGGVLKGVEGVTDAKCDQASKTVSFTAKDATVAAKAVQALLNAGFYGAATDDGKEIKAGEKAKSEKADVVTIQGVHVCCKQCQNGITALFKDNKVSFGEGKPQCDVKVSGKGLDRAEVLETLRKAGFNGK